MNTGLECPRTGPLPSIWGLWPEDVHGCYWASLGVQVIRAGSGAELEPQARTWLLTTGHEFVLFPFSRVANLVAWTRSKTVFIDIADGREPGMREFTVTDDELRLQRFLRVYRRPDEPKARAALTVDPLVAREWALRVPASDPWAELERRIAASRQASTTVSGSVYRVDLAAEVAAFVRDLVQHWRQPGSTIGRARGLGDGVWADDRARVERQARFVGPVWIGAGRTIDPELGVVGPTVLWDDPESRPEKPVFRWPIRGENGSGANGSGENGNPLILKKRPRPAGYPLKRAFDIVCSLIGLAVTLPFYPLIMALIWFEDGRPFFFAHKRQTFGGRDFPCLKFRTMRRDAEEIKKQLALQNQADGPQFFIADDPRILKIGKLLRKTNLDEIPQLFNVLLGHMSLVGPRPSPHNENQYCPEWRNARLSVRPGITGLWQVSRTREEGEDFQEWIRYDIEYVERCSFRLDLAIIWRTFRVVLG